MAKNIKNSRAKVEDKPYSISEAMKLVKEASYEKFDASVEVSFNMNLDTTKAEQQLRGSIVLPHGTGKTAKVLAVVEDGDKDAAKNADHVGGIEIMEKVEKQNWFDFDFIVTTPSMMPKLAKYGKVLGPKGLMPNPKLGTVTNDIATAIDNIKKGQVEYRTNKEGLINMAIGKVSFSEDQLVENYNSIFEIIKSKKPSTVKGDYIKSITVSSTMGPGIKVDKG